MNERATHLGGFLIAFRAHTQKTSQKKVLDLNVRIDLRQTAQCTEYVADHAVTSTE